MSLPAPLFSLAFPLLTAGFSLYLGHFHGLTPLFRPLPCNKYYVVIKKRQRENTAHISSGRRLFWVFFCLFGITTPNAGTCFVIFRHDKQTISAWNAKPPRFLPISPHFCEFRTKFCNNFHFKPCNFYENGYNRLYREGKSFRRLLSIPHNTYYGVFFMFWLVLPQPSTRCIRESCRLGSSSVVAV